MDRLEEILSRISRDQALFQSVEEAVRQGAVLPILVQLGWDTFNVREVIPEYSVGGGRVDYCLSVGESKAQGWKDQFETEPAAGEQGPPGLQQGGLSIGGRRI